MAKEFFHGDIQLFIDHRFNWQRYFDLRGDQVNVAEEVETYKSVLRTTGDICEDIEQGAHDHWWDEVQLENGKVIVPPHITAGYEKLRSAGLLCLTIGTEHGGYGLPALVNCAYLEMVSRADPSLMTIIGLQAGVASDIEKYGTDELKKQYLPRFASGELQGSMDLTEPQAGSDLGNIVTRARLVDGRWFIDGEKIFITNGGAPIHLVLARDGETYDDSRGTTNGLNLMLCPVALPDGKPNGVRVARVERKMGIHGSPTCVIEFDNAEAFLLGKRGQGFRAMLDLMNNARLGVAAQAIGVAEGAYRAAREYAAQRVQFGAPIIEQPLVKSMLTLMAINLQAARALLYRTCALIDMTEALRRRIAAPRTNGGGDDLATLQHEWERNMQLIRFFTPLCKYYATEISNHVTRQGIQLHGGIGYMAESVAGHYHSDSIITTIYEGTSEIQASFALKEMSKGALFATLETIRTDLESLGDRYPELVMRVAQGIGWITDSVSALMADPQYALLNAKRVCEMVIDVVASAELLHQADFGAGKKELAESYIHRHMLAVEMNARRVATGDASRIKRYDRILGLSSNA
jgi:alkylation response protein AidB-like acyl-CoA dehydrogenase